MELTQQPNHYSKSIPVVGCDLFAVEVEDGRWSITEGTSESLVPTFQSGSSKNHLPVRFKSQKEAVKAIINRPSTCSSLILESEWVRHCLKAGAKIGPEFKVLDRYN